MSERGDCWCTVTPASVHSLWSSPKYLNRLCLTVFSSLRSSLLCTFSYPISGERVIEPIKWMGMIRRHDWQGTVVGIWPGHWGYTPTLYEKCHGIFNDHRESRPRFNVSSEGRCFGHYTVVCSHYTGAFGPTQTAGWAPPAGPTNTSSNSNLVFPGGLPSRYWSAQPCLASVGNQSWAAGWYSCCQWSSSGPLPSQQCSPLLWFQRTKRYTECILYGWSFIETQM